MHVEIVYDGPRHEHTKLVIDGHDITKAVHAEGISVNIPGDSVSKASVTFTLAADRLDITLPASLVVAHGETTAPAEDKAAV